ncbi:MAG: zinc ribbon domain-containing protein [Deltaproteobacteria bacterium]|nr:zinc ribbon domain-containing protein [Deltaproteobacteria bacterium]
MPTYEYHCKACDHEFEREQRITEDPVKKCPECGKLKVKRLISSGSSFQLKGGGWYNEGYHEKPAKKSGEQPSANSSESGGSKGSEKKSAEKTDTKKSSDTSKK